LPGESIDLCRVTSRDGQNKPAIAGKQAAKPAAEDARSAQDEDA
jgi:hypothetical protein